MLSLFVDRFEKWREGWNLKSAAYFWRVSKNNSMSRFIIQHANLFLGFYIFYFFLPAKAELLMMDVVSSIYFSLPHFLQVLLTRMDILFSSAPYMTVRGIASFFLSLFINSICPTTPANAFRMSLAHSAWLLVGYIGLMCIVCIKRVLQVLSSLSSLLPCQQKS